MDLSIIRYLAEENKDYVTELRREFHRHPEISGQELLTRQTIIRELESMGTPYRLLPGTGVIAIIEGARPGRGRVIRADMDGLAVKETRENLCRPKVCVSEINGVSHACGHDAHMAMLLGTIRILMSLRDEIIGTIYCCFEEGEETNCGVAVMLEALSEYDIAECFALHVYNALESGKLDISPGPRMAGNIHIGIRINGVSGHGSRPDQAVNPIVPAAHIITQLYSAFLNQLDAEETVTLGLCQLQAGTGGNIIPEYAFIGGTARYFSAEEGKKAVSIIRTISENTALSHRCTVEFQPTPQLGLFPVINDATVSTHLQKVIEGICGNHALGSCGKWYASECYSKYLQHYPGALGLLGIQNEFYGSGAAHHNGRFDIDEEVLPLGVCAEVAFAITEMALD